MVEIRCLTAGEGRQQIAALAGVLLDCVEGGASVSFMASLSKAGAESYFEDVVAGVQAGDRILLAAFFDYKLEGTVQILISMPPNQPRASSGCCQTTGSCGRLAGRASAADSWKKSKEVSRQAGKTLRVLDTATGNRAQRSDVHLGGRDSESSQMLPRTPTEQGGHDFFLETPSRKMCGATSGDQWRSLGGEAISQDLEAAGLGFVFFLVPAGARDSRSTVIFRAASLTRKALQTAWRSAVPG